MDQQTGSISLFFSIVMAPLLLFMACCVDIVQVSLAKKELAIVSDSVNRSVLAGFDSNVQAYGLYGYDATDRQIFHQYLKLFRLQLGKSPSVHWTHHENLGDYNQMKLQILKEMKWRAPIAWMKQMMKPFQTLDSNTNPVKPGQIVDLTSQMESLLNKKTLTLALIRTSLQELRVEWNNTRQLVDSKFQELLAQLQSLAEIEQLLRNVSGILIPATKQNPSLVQPIIDELQLIIQNKIYDVDAWFEKTDHYILQMASAANQSNSNEQRSDINKTLNQFNLLFNENCRGTHKNYDRLKKLFIQPEQSKEVDSLPSNVSQLMDKLKQSKAMLSTLSEIVQQPLTSTRDRLLISEFVLQKFNHKLSYLKQSTERSMPESHTLRNQEIEYILSGYYSCEANDKATIAKLYLIRVILRLTEFVVRPELNASFAANPLTFVLAGLSYASAKAGVDIAHLLAGRFVPLIEFSLSSVKPIMMSYEDHLRLLLWTLPNRTQMKRIQGLIEFNTGKKMSDLTVGLSMKSSVVADTIIYPFNRVFAQSTYLYE